MEFASSAGPARTWAPLPPSLAAIHSRILSSAAASLPSPSHSSTASALLPVSASASVSVSSEHVDPSAPPLTRRQVQELAELGAVCLVAPDPDQPPPPPPHGPPPTAAGSTQQLMLPAPSPSSSSSSALSRFRQRQRAGGREVWPYYKQGNVDWYEQRLLRRREALKFHPQLMNIVKKVGRQLLCGVWSGVLGRD